MANLVETVGVRLGKFLASQDISYRQFEKQAGWSNGLAGKVINKGVSFGVDKLEQIFVAFPQLNPTWLITGLEHMIRQLPNQSQDDAHRTNTAPDSSPIAHVEEHDLKSLGFTEKEAKAFVTNTTGNLSLIHFIASFERLLVFIENSSSIPDGDKKKTVQSLYELRRHLFQSVNQAIVSEAKYSAALDAIKLLAPQPKPLAE